jgi:hypothetical protein
MKALEVAMEMKGWTVHQTSLVTGVTDQSLRNLLRHGETRRTVPSSVTAFTMCRLLEAFPSLDIDDFMGSTTLTIRRKERG